MKTDIGYEYGVFDMVCAFATRQDLRERVCRPLDIAGSAGRMPRAGALAIETPACWHQEGVHNVRRLYSGCSIERVRQHANAQARRSEGHELHRLGGAALGAVHGGDGHRLRRRRVVAVHRPARELARFHRDGHGGRGAARKGVLAGRAQFLEGPPFGVDYRT